MIPLAIIFALVFIVGTCFGSFYNVCVYRIPVGKSINFPPSSCICGARIPFYYNIPIIGWLVLRGKSHCCNTSISPRYIITEVMVGLLFVAIVAKYGLTVESLIWIVYTSILFIVTWIDFDTQTIPDRFSFMLLGLAACVIFWQPSILNSTTVMGAFKQSLNGFALGTAVISWIIFLSFMVLKKEGMGWGDAKLLAGIGAVTGANGVFMSFMLGSVIGGGLILTARQVFKVKALCNGSVPFGPVLIIGTVANILWPAGFLDFWMAPLRSVASIFG